jgi:hypothetical protein
VNPPTAGTATGSATTAFAFGMDRTLLPTTTLHTATAAKLDHWPMTHLEIITIRPR